MKDIARVEREKSADSTAPGRGADVWLRRLRSMMTDQHASTAVVFGLALPATLVGTAMAIQYGSLVLQHTAMQRAADAGALGAAKQLSLAGKANAQSASAAGISIAREILANQHLNASDQITANVIKDNTYVDLTIEQIVPPIFGGIVGVKPYTLRVHAIGHYVGGAPICAIALDPKAAGAVTVDAQAVVDAHKCAVYSNSKHKHSIAANQSAVLKSALACAAGGLGGSYANFDPQPKTGCPAITDPLAKRPEPAGPAGHCDYPTAFTPTGPGLHYLIPGVYCGGMKIQSGQTVSLSPGTYIMDGGPLEVDDGATMQGDNVGFLLTKTKASAPKDDDDEDEDEKDDDDAGPPVAGPAPGSTIYFAPGSTISLTAPKSGDMAGLLFFESRKMTKNRLHQIMSNKAQTLTGTVYLPKGRLFIGSNAPVSASSKFTVIVSNTLELSAGPTLVLNTDYGATDVPVPEGVGPQGGTAVLTQ